MNGATEETRSGANGAPVFIPNENPTPSLRFVGADDAVSKLLDAVAKARKGFGEIKKDRKGQSGHQVFKYSPIANLTDASIGPLSDNGIAVMQFLTSSPVPDRHRLTTIVSGHGARIEAFLDFKPEGDNQSYGKQTTYLRRYAINAIFVLDGTPDLDDAGEAEKDPTKRPMTAGQHETIKGMFSKIGMPPEEQVPYAEKLVGKPIAKFMYMDADKVIKDLGAKLDSRKPANGGRK